MVTKSVGAGEVSFVRGEAQSRQVEEERAANPDEIDIDDDSDEDEKEVEGKEGERKVVGEVEKQAIPSKVFGGLKKEDDDDD